MDSIRKWLSIVGGIGGVLFIGYCVYFDKKRRSDPDFKKKLRARREEKRRKENAKNISQQPNFNDHEAIQRYFVQEIQMGETLIARGNFETGVEHLANALVVCSQAGRLLQVLQSTLPAEAFTMLVMRMQEVGVRERRKDHTTANANAKMSMSTTWGTQDTTSTPNSATASHTHTHAHGNVIDDLE